MNIPPPGTPKPAVTVVKRFAMKHHDFEGTDYFTTEDPPKWLLHKQFKWFYDKHLLTLGVGQFVDTDFRRFTRIN